MLFAKNYHRCGLFGKNSRLRCFVANFIADGFTRFLCYFFGAKSALVLIFTLLECLICIQNPRMSEKKRFRSICFCGALLLPRVLRIGWFSQMCYCVTATSCRRQSEEASLVSTSRSQLKAIVPLAVKFKATVPFAVKGGI